MSAPEAGAGEPASTDLVVVAAGSSNRMAGRDKMEAIVAGRPLIAWTLAALAATPGIRRIVIVTAAAKVPALAQAPWLPDQVVAVVAGGARRQESVAAGVAALGEGAPADVILVHDGARPLVSPSLVAAVAAAVAAHGAAIPVLAVAETVKRIADGRIAGTVPREDLATAQTPQGARRGILEAAWAAYPPDGPETFTDEASLLEACRIPVEAIPGEPINLKVTLPDDLVRVEAALRARDAVVSAASASASTFTIAAPAVVRPRVGFGDDVHPFGPGAPLALGGITIEGAPRLHGHSDGDVLLHAVCDALLGAAGLGDLGRVFPAGPSTPRGIASSEMVAACLRRVRASGYRPDSVDCTVVAARPRLAARLPEMAAAIAALLDLPSDRVNVKASTGNLAGWEGTGRGISARAIALLLPEDQA